MGKVLSIVLALLLTAVGTPMAATNAEQAQTFLENGRKALDRGEPNSAITLFRKAIESDPSNGAARFALAITLSKIGDLADVEDQLHAAQDAGYDADEVAAALAEYLNRAGKYGRVLDEIPEGNRSSDLESRVRTARGFAQLNLRRRTDAELAFKQGIARAQTGLAQTRIVAGDLAGAIDLLQQVIAVQPEFADPWILLGRIRVLQNDPAAARAAFDKAVALAPDNLAARLDRAALLAEIDDKTAADDIAIILDQVPDNWRANLLDGIIKARHERWRDAEAALMNIAAPETLPDALFTLARVHLALGQIGQADTDITHYLAIVPNDPKGLAVKAGVLMAVGKPSGAVDLLNQALASVPDNTSLLALLSDAYTRNGQNKEAAATLDRLATVAPRDAQTRLRLATQRIAVGQIDAALDDLAIARAAEPLSPKSTSLAVEALLAAGRLDEATAAAEELRRQSPDSAVAETFLGVIDVRRSKLPDARGHFEKALAAQPSFAMAAIDLAQTYRVEQRMDDARGAFDRALGQDPKTISVLLARADLEIADGKPDAAIGFLERARVADPQALEPRFRLVRGYIAGKEGAKAVGVAYELERIAPRDPKAVTALAEAQLANNDRATAIGTFERVVALTASAPEPMLRLAGVLVTGGDVQGGYRTVRRALEANPGETLVQRAMLEYSVKMGMVGASIDFVRELQQRRPNDANLDLLLGDLYQSDRKFERAVIAYEAGVAKRGGVDLVRGLARAQAHAATAEAAIQTLDDWLAKQPEDSETRALLASILENAHLTDRAVTEYRRVLASAPDNAPVLNNLALLYFRRSDDRAAATAERAYAIAPQSPTIEDTIGWILVSKGEIQRGLEILRQAAAKSPDAATRYHLAVALSRAGLHDDAIRVLGALLESGVQFDDLAAAQQLKAKLGG